MNTLQLEQYPLQKTPSLNIQPSDQAIDTQNMYEQPHSKSHSKRTSLKSNVQILHQIHHRVNPHFKHQTQLHDFLCLKDVSSTPKQYSFDGRQNVKPNAPKPSLVMLCECKDDRQSNHNSIPLNSSIQQILSCLQSFTHQHTNSLNLCSILYPRSTKPQSLPSYPSSSFIQISINHIPLPFSSFESFLPISSLNWNAKTQSQMFCLNKLYRFLLTVAKPLKKLIESFITQFKVGVDVVNEFFMNVLVKQNIYHQDNSGAFYLLLVPHRGKSINSRSLSPSKSVSKCQNVDFKKVFSFYDCFHNIFKHFSQIFWSIFIFNHQLQKPSNHQLGKPSNNQLQKPQSDLHASFLQNFLSSAIKGQLSLDQALQILQSKQKRKSFIKQKITLSANKTQKQKRTISINNTHHLNQGSQYETRPINRSRYEPNDQTSYQMSQLNLYNDKLSKKRKSVHRKLTGKRNTIDVILQYSAQKNIPPSFQSRSHDKKSRLFKHDLGYKNREQKSHSSHSKQRNYQTINGSVNLNNSSSGKTGVNVYENFSFMVGTTHKNSDKKANVSKTIEVSEIRARNNHSQLQGHERENEENQYGKSRDRLANFLKTNHHSKDFMRKSSTHNISTLVQNDKPSTKFDPQSKTLTTTNQLPINMQKRQSIAITSKNRRYYHINNFISESVTNHNQSIETLIQTQKRLLERELQHSKSKERDLLNRSQEKAFAAFNKEIKSRHLERDKSQQMSNQQKSLLTSKKQPYIAVTTTTNDKVSAYLDKKAYNLPKSQHDQNSQPKRLHVKQLSTTKRLSQHHLSAFSPPKKHKSTHGLDREMSLGLKESAEMTDSKIDDRQFRLKFSLLHVNRNVISSNDQSMVNESQYGNQDRVQQEPLLKVKQVKQVVEPPKGNKVNEEKFAPKINNEYMHSQDVNDMDKEEQPPRPQPKLSEKPHKLMDRTEKNLINAGKKLNQKLNNKNFNIEQVFAQQELLAKQQKQIRQLSSPVEIVKQQPKRKYSQAQNNAINNNNPNQEQQKVRKFSTSTQKGDAEKNNQLSRYKQMEDSEMSRDRIVADSLSQRHSKVNHQELKESFQELTELISPIKPSSKGQAKKETTNPKVLQKPITKPKSISQASSVYSSKPKPTLNKAQDLTSFNPVDDNLNQKQDKAPIKEQKHQQPKPKPVNEPPKMQSTKNNPPLSIDRLQHSNIQQAVVLQRKTQDNKSKPLQNRPAQSNNKPKPNPNPSNQSLSNIKQPKDMPTKPKITEDQEFQLQEIKFTPAKPKPNPTHQQNTSDKPTQSKPLASTLSKPPLPNQPSTKPPQSKSQSPTLNPRIHQQQPSSPANSTKKNSKQPKRQATTQSVASSFGPHKTIKKIVQQYVFMVNKIGQAVAKTPKIAKKVQAVTDWYVGAYFLYKRFLYQRKKMQKYLKQGTPKLTRYDEQINLDQWKTYLKSPERHMLMTKISQQNINIAKSIQKMQGKLLGKNIPESIKQHAAISQRTSRESVIAVDAIIDEFDTLVQKGMLKDDDILAHCTEMFNACLIIAELDQLVEDIVPVSEFSKGKRTLEQLQMIAQDLYDLYHDE